MKTYGVNALAETLEKDRSTMVRALRNVAPDAELGKRPQWKIATAAKALALHEANAVGSGNRNTGTNPQLEALADEFHAAEAAMKKLKTLSARRAAAVAMAPLIAQADKMMRQVGIASGKEPDYAHLLADRVFMIMLRSFEVPCGWSQEETWKAIDICDR
jgi:hypothetical protein